MSNPLNVRTGGKVFTTGQIAKMCQVAPRTVSKWIDTGILPGYKIPAATDGAGKGGSERRVSRESLLAFLKARGVPVPAVLGDHITVATALPAAEAARAGLEVLSWFQLARACVEQVVGWLVVGDGIPHDEAVHMMEQVRQLQPHARVVLIVAEDVTPSVPAYTDGVYVFNRPVDIALIAKLLR